MKKCILILLLISHPGFSCTVTVPKKNYIAILKIKGDINPDIKYSEAVGLLSYSGSEDLVFLSENEKPIATIKSGIVCVIRNDESNHCAESKGAQLEMWHFYSQFGKNGKYTLYAQFGNSKLEKYVFTKVRVKNNDKYQAQIYQEAAAELCKDF